MESWDDVNQALRRMGELKIKQAVAAARLKVACDAAQAVYDLESAQYEKECKELDAACQSFATAHKSEFLGKTRTKKMSFGAVQFKTTGGKVVLTLAPEMVIANLRAQGHEECIHVEESVDKDIAKTLDPKDLLKAGIKIVKEDVCTIKPDLKKVQEALKV